MRILFMGDSITDMYRSKEDDHNFGVGYALLVRASLGFEEPGKYEFFNRGISGNRIVDIYARMKSDIVELKPDVMSILVGVNDIWHDYLAIPNGVSVEKYFKVYDMLIEELKEELPELKIIILEPFVLKARIIENIWDDFNKGVRERAVMAKKIAEKHNLPFIPLQQGFDDLSKDIDTTYWLEDGVHPTSMGHEYIKREWINAFKSYIR